MNIKDLYTRAYVSKEAAILSELLPIPGTPLLSAISNAAANKVKGEDESTLKHSAISTGGQILGTGIGAYLGNKAIPGGIHFGKLTPKQSMLLNAAQIFHWLPLVASTAYPWLRKKKEKTLTERFTNYFK